MGMSERKWFGSSEWKKLLEQGKAYTPNGIEGVGGGA
jgi:hypothetical protein